MQGSGSRQQQLSEWNTTRLMMELSGGFKLLAAGFHEGGFAFVWRRNISISIL